MKMIKFYKLKPTKKRGINGVSKKKKKKQCFVVHCQIHALNLNFFYPIKLNSILQNRTTSLISK
jgi:hypothetical protein